MTGPGHGVHVSNGGDLAVSQEDVKGSRPGGAKCARRGNGCRWSADTTLPQDGRMVGRQVGFPADVEPGEMITSTHPPIPCRGDILWPEDDVGVCDQLDELCHKCSGSA